MQANRAAVAFLAFILFLVFIGVLLAATLGHHSGKKPSTTSNTPAKVLTLPEYSNTTAVTSLLIDGRVVGDESHRAIRISVGQNQREVDIIQGYSGNVISSTTYYNTQNAYFVFLTAINNSGFMAKRPVTKKAPASPADERGQCPLGDRYIFELDQYGSPISRLWASDCGVSVGTLGGSSSLLRNLFEAQIPKYSTVVSGVQL